MAIIKTTELVAKRSATVTPDGVTRKRVFLVKTDSHLNDDTSVELAPGISIYAAHPNDADCYCTSIDTSEIEPFVWNVTFTYTSPITACEINPLTCSPEISWSTEKEEEVFKEDVDGDKVVNTLKELFQPLPTRLKSRAVLTVTYNSASFSGATALAIDSKINNATYEGAAARTLLCSIESATRQWHSTIGYYWKITVKMVYNEDTWDLEVANTSVNEIDPNDNTKKRRIKLHGREVSHPVPIDELTNEAKDPTDDPDYITFKPYEAIDFSTYF